MGKWFQTAMLVVWIPTWMAAIWISTYRGQLYWTGLFALVLGLIDASGNQSSTGSAKNE